MQTYKDFFKKSFLQQVFLQLLQLFYWERNAFEIFVRPEAARILLQNWLACGRVASDPSERLYHRSGWQRERSRAARPWGRRRTRWSRRARSPGRWCSPPHAARGLREEQRHTGQKILHLPPSFRQRGGPAQSVKQAA